jgi:hypothetical protein
VQELVIILFTLSGSVTDAFTAPWATAELLIRKRPKLIKQGNRNDKTTDFFITSEIRLLIR